MSIALRVVPGAVLGEIAFLYRLKPAGYSQYVLPTERWKGYAWLVGVAATIVLIWHDARDWSQRWTMTILLFVAIMCVIWILLDALKRSHIGLPRLFLVNDRVVYLNGRELRAWRVDSLKSIENSQAANQAVLSFASGDTVAAKYNASTVRPLSEFLEKIWNVKRQLDLPFSNAPIGTLSASIPALEAFLHAYENSAVSRGAGAGVGLVGLASDQGVGLGLGAALTALGVLIAIPRLIDHNNFEAAASLDTAGAYRTYLGQPRNELYRTEARERIRALYDRYIASYRARAGTTPGAAGMVRVLEFMRDRDRQTMAVQSTVNSRVRRLRTPGYMVHDIAPAFSTERNSSRNSQVVSILNQSLSTFFPKDIASTSGALEVGAPILAVSYTYFSMPNSLYYPEAQASSPRSERDWYQGIGISWRFSIHIPGHDEPIDGFELESEPAPRFQSRRVDAESVYDGMVASAFEDFVTRLNTRYFTFH